MEVDKQEIKSLGIKSQSFYLIMVWGSVISQSSLFHQT